MTVSCNRVRPRPCGKSAISGINVKKGITHSAVGIQMPAHEASWPSTKQGTNNQPGRYHGQFSRTADLSDEELATFTLSEPV